MHRITCYKLCYLLGVSSEKLAEDFVLEHRLAARSSYFPKTAAMRRLRALTGTFFLLLKRYKECVEVSAFTEVASEEIATLAMETGYNPVEERGSDKLSDYLKRVVTEQHILLEEVWEDSNIALTLDQFKLIVQLPRVTDKSLPILLFLHQKTDHLYGMYFYGRECLSVSFGAMLRDDLALRDRLSLYYGERLPSMNDRTVFATALEAYACAVFVSAESLARSYKVILGMSGTSKADSKIREAFEGLDVDEQKLSDLDMAAMDSRSCIVSADNKWIAEMCIKYPQVQFGAVLPIESKFYNQWRKRKYENIWLIGH